MFTTIPAVKSALGTLIETAIGPLGFQYVPYWPGAQYPAKVAFIAKVDEWQQVAYDATGRVTDESFVVPVVIYAQNASAETAEAQVFTAAESVKDALVADLTLGGLLAEGAIVSGGQADVGRSGDRLFEAGITLNVRCSTTVR